MKALVIGDGGPEHALAWKLAQSPAVTVVYSAPGNYGSNLVGPNVNIPVTAVEELASWAKENAIDLTVVGSATALGYGVVDAFREQGLRIVGPTQAAARLEMSRSWARSFMARHGIPTVAHHEFESGELQEAGQYLRQLPGQAYPVVVRPDSPWTEAQVTLADDPEAALAVVQRALRTPRSGTARRVLIEEHLEGAEVSQAALTDGTTTLPLEPVRLYRRAGEAERGALTGGMGACPIAAATSPLAASLMDRILNPALVGMATEGLPFQGLLDAEVLLTAQGPRVLGFNVRFGDPQTQALLPRWEDDLYVVLDALVDAALAELRPAHWAGGSTCAVVLASEGYPGEIETGYGVLGLGDAASSSATLVFHNATRNPYRKETELLTPTIERAQRSRLGLGLGSWLIPSRGRSQKVDRQAQRASNDPYSQVVTGGGRVVTVVGRGATAGEARAAAYRGAEQVTFTGCWYRQDIGAADDFEERLRDYGLAPPRPDARDRGREGRR